MSESERKCAWCHGPIPVSLRADAVCCSTRCRQARHRFTTAVGTVQSASTAEPIRLAYADPPYPGLSKRYYGDHPDFAGEVDHRALIESLSQYDGWALSTSARALPLILALCPQGVRVAAWHRGERPTRSYGPLNAWEPVIFWGGRLDVERDASIAAGRDASILEAQRVARSRDDGSRRTDSLVLFSRPRLTDPLRVVGAKPAGFCRWMFDLLGAEPFDEFVDVFPGSGGVQRAWDVFASNQQKAVS